jgi:nucleotide-binding universal stress UspA family protein
VAAELLTAATEADLLVLGRAGRQAAPRHWLGSTARTAVAQHQHPILLMPPSYDLSQPPLLLYDGSAAAQRALLLAVTLAEKHGRLSILFLTSDATIAQQWQQTLQTQLAGEALQIEYRMVSDVTGLAAVFSSIEVGLIVAGQVELPLSRAIIESLFQAGEQPMLLVQ